VAYYYSRTIRATFDDAVNRTIDALKGEGFGVLTEIDVEETLKKKLNTAFRPYRILGACSPDHAYKALLAEDKIGTLLPCNVIVYEKEGKTVVGAFDPMTMVPLVGKKALQAIAADVKQRLEKVLANI